jgi:hypothetical protein
MLGADGFDAYKIPLSLLEQAIELLEYIDVSIYDEPIPWEYEIVLSAFRKKRRQLELRRAYAEIIFAPNEDKRFDARMRYLQKKRHITDG